MVVDLRTAEGQDEARRLVRNADVVVEAFESGQAAEWGLDYPDVSADNKSLVYCSIKGFGPTGAYATIKAYDAVVCAKAGLFARGDFAFRPGPIFNGASLPSNGAAHMGLAGVLAALVVRDATGIGQRVDTSLWQALNPLDYYFSYHVQLGRIAAEEAKAAGREVRVSQSASGSVATRYSVIASTKDGNWLAFSPQMAHQSQALVKVLGLEDMLDDPRFAQMPEFSSLADAQEWDRRVWTRLKEQDADVWIERALANKDLPFGQVLSAEEALDHPQVRQNGNRIILKDPELGDIEQVGPVAAFEKTPAVPRRSAPRLGQNDGAIETRDRQLPSGDLPSQPLDGVTIVEFGYFYAMPYGVAMASSFGARVIKVEAIGGDPIRSAFGAAEWGSCKVTEGKETIALDLRLPEGQAIFRQLIGRADVFVQGFRPGVDVRMGADYETLRNIKPDLVYVHATGYGTQGPYADRAMYAGVACALTGSVHRQAGYWFDRDLAQSLSAEEAQAVIAPRLRTAMDGDANAALAVLSAIMLGIRHHQRTGEGQLIETSMIGGNVLAYSDDFNRYEGKVALPNADAEQLGLGATYRLYETSDGWCFFAATTDAEFRRATAVMERGDLEADERFSTGPNRAKHDDELVAALSAVFKTRTALQWESSMTSESVGCVEVRTDSQAMMTCTDPVLLETGLVREIDHPQFGRLVRYGPPATLSATPTVAGPGCTFAQHTAAILAELGYDPTAVEDLVEQGVAALPK